MEGTHAGKRRGTRLTAIAMSVLLILALVPGMALASTTSEARQLIQQYYVDEVSNEVLNAPTVQEMLKGLNDPWAEYFTAQEISTYLNEIDNRFTGIGVRIVAIPEGIQISSVIADSPAEKAGLRAGDVIVAADGVSLRDVSTSVAVSLLQGEEGTQVVVTILRGEERLNVSITRAFIQEPTVKGTLLDNGVAYIQINSFGEDTAAEFGAAVKELQQEAGLRGWVIDLRDNPGGYLNAALDIGSYLFGEETVIHMENRYENEDYYSDYASQINFNYPVILLTNEYSASASEVVAAAFKDYQTGSIVGTQTYGKGVAQSMFDLTDGSVLKFTTDRFYSPLKNEIQDVGIAPDLNIEGDALDGAWLLLSGSAEKGNLRLVTQNQTYYIDLQDARQGDFWPEYQELLASAVNSGGLQSLSLMGYSGWQAVNLSDFQTLWPLYYSGYKELGTLENVKTDKEFTIRFAAPVRWDTVNGQTMELIAADTGERIPLTFTPNGDQEIKARPGSALKAETDYWLVIHPGIQGTAGGTLQQGAVTVVKTAAAAVAHQDEDVWQPAA